MNVTGDILNSKIDSLEQLISDMSIQIEQLIELISLSSNIEILPSNYISPDEENIIVFINTNCASNNLIQFYANEVSDDIFFGCFSYSTKFKKFNLSTINQSEYLMEEGFNLNILLAVNLRWLCVGIVGVRCLCMRACIGLQSLRSRILKSRMQRHGAPMRSVCL